MSTDTAERVAPDQSDKGDESQLVTFQLGDEEFGFDIMSVQEIIRLPKLARVPKTPDYVEGVANLRGVVLPVIDTRARFGMPRSEETDRTRVLVLDVNGAKTGLRVDRVRQVTRVTRSATELPPPIIRGIQGNFLKSVVKLDDGKRIIMALDPARVCEITLAAPDGPAGDRPVTGAGRPALAGPASGEPSGSAGVEQVVTFRLAREEFAFRISRVREILRVEVPKEVPDTPPHVLGVLTVRGRILPIVDLRRLLGHASLADEMSAACEAMRSAYASWLDRAVAQVAAGSKAVAPTAPEAVRAWLGDFNPASGALMEPAVRLRTANDAVLKACAAPSAETFEPVVTAAVAEAASALAGLSGLFEKHVREDQRVIVVESRGLLLGLVVDRVSEVLNVPGNLIDPPPQGACGGGMELSGIARLEDGKRLILLLDNDHLLNGHDLSTSPADGPARSAEGPGDQTKENAVKRDQPEGAEQQLVTFILDGEEYGIPISQIQEIDRVGQVKRIPKAPAYVEGVTNLRGEVVPVINTRRRFDLPAKARDDRDRIIIVDVDGHKTGLLVDSVRENLNLPRRDISPPPATLDNGVDSRFISGIGKVGDGKRMIVLLDVRKVLGGTEATPAAAAAA